MQLQFLATHLMLVIPFVATDTIINEGLRLRPNFVDCRRFKNPPQFTDNPVEYMKTPNFDVIFLSEENSNPVWRKYADLFQPIDLRNAQRIEVSYGSNSFSNAGGFRPPSINLNRFEVESVLTMLGRKKHIIVLRPRNCKPYYTRRVIEKRLMDEFKNAFLHKLLQQQHQTERNRQAESDMIDPIIYRVLEVLDDGDQKMINDLKKRFEVKSSRSPPEGTLNYPLKSLSGNAYENPCNENYVFLLQNQENSADPNSLNDLLLRVLRIVTTESN